MCVCVCIYVCMYDYMYVLTYHETACVYIKNICKCMYVCVCVYMYKALMLIMVIIFVIQPTGYFELIYKLL